jgi:hypothetical protein
MAKVHYKYDFISPSCIVKEVRVCNFTKFATDADTKDKDKVTCTNCKKILKRGFVPVYNKITKKKEKVIL